MNLNDLRSKARDSNDWTAGLQLCDLLMKLQTLFKEKWDSMEGGRKYFEELGCEIRLGYSGSKGFYSYKGSKDFVPVNFILKRWLKEQPSSVHINVPVEIAEKALVIGLP